MLHDVGLVEEFDSHRVLFEEAGGHVAWVFGARAGWPVVPGKNFHLLVLPELTSSPASLIR